MITLEQIQAEARKYARQAQRQAREPLQLWWQDVQDMDSFRRVCAKVPALGDYVHPDWQAFDTNTKGLWVGRTGQSPAPFATYSYAWFFVDATGLGSDDEPALSVHCFHAAMRFLLLAHDTAFGLGIREVGEFQVHVGLYVRQDAQWDGSRFKVAGLHELASQPYMRAGRKVCTHEPSEHEKEEINP